MFTKAVSPRVKWGSLVLVAFVWTACPLAAASGTGAYRAAIALEREGRLADAANLLKHSRLAPAKRAHEHALSGALHAMGAAAAYEQHGQPVAARDALAAALEKLDPARDVYVAIELRKRLAAATDAASHGLDRQARATLGQGRDDERRGRLAQAKIAYEAVVGLAKAGVAPVLVDQARAGELRVERTAEPQRGHFVRLGDWIGDQFATLGGWLAPVVPILLLVSVALLLMLVPRLRRPKANQTLINLTDWSTDRTDRAQESFALARQFKAEIDAAARGSDSSSSEIDETRDLDGSLVPGLKVTGDEIGGINALLPDGAAIKVGPIQFSLLQLIGLVRAPFRRRPQYELVGSLTTEGKRSILEADLRPNDGSKSRHWEAALEGDDSRQEAIREVATRVAVEVGRSYISENWRSVREYRAAREKLDAMDAATREQSLAEIRNGFQRALDQDQHNLLARFYLATVLRSLGDNRSAVKQLDFLDRLLDRRSALGASAREFLDRHPDFELSLRYNEAAALAKIPDSKAHDRAMGILAALEERLKASGRQRRAPANGPVLEAADAQRLLFLVKGAQAAGLVFELEQWADRSDGSRPPKRRIRTAFTKIKAIRDQLTSEAPESGRRSSAAHVQALAAAENAYGRALYLTQKSTQQSTDDAAEAFNNAVALVPDFADAWVNFATLLIRRRPPDWESRADDASARAVELTPRSSKAHYLRGLFFEQTKDDDEAEKEYTAAGEDAKTTVKLAQIAERKGDFSTAAKRCGPRCPSLRRRTTVPSCMWNTSCASNIRAKASSTMPNSGHAICKNTVRTSGSARSVASSSERSRIYDRACSTPPLTSASPPGTLGSAAFRRISLDQRQ
jgi:hypothetical protein